MEIWQALSRFVLDANASRPDLPGVQRHRKLPEDAARYFLKQLGLDGDWPCSFCADQSGYVVSGLSALYAHNCLHRDLKPVCGRVVWVWT